jgi:hypothetical protein
MLSEVSIHDCLAPMLLDFWEGSISWQGAYGGEAAHLRAVGKQKKKE